MKLFSIDFVIEKTAEMKILFTKLNLFPDY